MIVLEKDLKKPHEVIDIVTTPDGSPVAMVHCNNCTSDLNAWVNLFKEFEEVMGIPVDMGQLFTNLFNVALKGNPDCGGIMSYNYVSGEPVTGFADGRPLFVRSANDKFNLANFMRAIISGAIGVLKVGNDILFNEDSPISCMKTAGEGGPWGMAILASYLINNKKNQSLAEFLDDAVFAGDTGTSVAPTPEDVAGFNAYIENYKKCLPIEEAAVKYKN